MSKVKPILVIDDDSASCVLTLGMLNDALGCPIVYFKTIEDFLKHYNIGEDLDSVKHDCLAEVLSKYSNVIVDNDFHSGGGKISGIDFINRAVGPALTGLRNSDNPAPVVTCMSSTSVDLLMEVKENLFEKYRILAFEKGPEDVIMCLHMLYSRCSDRFLLKREDFIELLFGNGKRDIAARSDSVLFREVRGLTAFILSDGRFLPYQIETASVIDSNGISSLGQAIDFDEGTEADPEVALEAFLNKIEGTGELMLRKICVENLLPSQSLNAETLR